MPFEEFDKKVNEAADHHHPAYDEKAWAKMEKLLDKHLPQKDDDRRKYILLLLLFLLTGGGVYLMIAKPWQSNKSLVVSEKTVPQSIPANSLNTTDAGNSEKINTDSTQSKTDAASPSKVKKAKSGIKKSNSFFLSLSTGPDISFPGLDDLGKTKLLAGAGIGYTFKNKFTLRTGFYTGRKIYSAQPYQYHTTGTPNPNYTLERVDADCRVYEIPLLLSYNFNHSVRQSWFATAGVSSYLMKRETYDYHYKSSTGQVYTHQWTFRDENKHYFSVLTLSGGYQRKINNTFSLMAEPYIKIPMVGVGSGKVKLNSAGVLLSVGINLFGSSKNKAGN